jgi:hypothetical protein
MQTERARNTEGAERPIVAAQGAAMLLSQAHHNRAQYDHGGVNGSRSDADSVQSPTYKGHHPQKEPLPEVRCRQLRDLIRHVAALERGDDVSSAALKKRQPKYDPEPMPVGEQLASLGRACFLVDQCLWRCREDIELRDGDGDKIMLDEEGLDIRP